MQLAVYAKHGPDSVITNQDLLPIQSSSDLVTVGTVETEIVQKSQ